jgi:hypothetical protein
MSGVRRTLALYLGGAMVLAVLVLLGTVLLAGALGPWIVLVVVAAGAWALHRWVRGQLSDAALVDDERVLQTMASGLLVLAVGFGAVAAIVLTAVG